ncbi:MULTISPECIES: DNA replication terminus site-binding protein [Tatumella]|uniref:DNA replication terminus site-binding protein n=1 Tax=Tatumella punctata TaxID=399969 RepID=A0ABW1VIT7_9GAMM|nr:MULTISPECIES: DNA replication terminus site-binding protein [unclassified Tatumella]MBS0855069.1 DNA replication terminus site-binding protein [Tatumella sp. JGM16]MBS0892685.1 DNA replication terminus site-binding protein [Tatumella sp. JGM130]MBS0911964.1 DNA replication terminus site-binding protein [Tatumella sp. JGM91]
MRYTLVSEMRECINLMEHQLRQLADTLQQLPLLAARVFSLPPVMKGDEQNATETISVQQFTGQTAREMALGHLQRLFMQQQSENVSTRAAVRLPGALCFKTDRAAFEQLQQQTDGINQLKLLLEQLITRDSGLSSEARFPFVHQHFPGLITLNAYRSVTLLPAPASVHFGWANKHIIRNVSRDEICQQLEKSLSAGRAKAPWTREQWAEKVAAELELVAALPADARLKIKRPVKVQPVARLWDRQKKQQRQLPCPTPLIFCCPDHNVPVIGELTNYDQQAINHRYKPAAQPMTLLIPRLWLWQASDNP